MKHRQSKLETGISLFLTFLFGFIATINGQQLKVNSLFSDNMVLQRNQNITVWGTSKPGDEIFVSFMKDKYSAQADSSGSWEIKIGNYKAGGPYEMNISSGDEHINFKNILIGDVWICSGQSNMNMPMAGWGRVADYEEEISKADYPKIRLLTIPLTLAPEPQQTVDCGGWDICTPENIEQFSAAAYYFGKEVFEKTNIPIGLLHVSKGGTPVESWMCQQALSDREDLKEKINFVKEGNNNLYNKLNSDYKKEFKNWLSYLKSNDLGYLSKPAWYDKSINISGWEQMELPQVWENVLGKFDGVVWFAIDINIPESWLGSDLILNLGPTQDLDIAYFNGKEVGAQSSRNSLSIYTVDKNLVNQGENRIAVRVLDMYGAGGLWGRFDKFEITNLKNEKISLKGNWHYKQSVNLEVLANQPPDRPNPDRYPTILFNGMISPLLNVRNAGVIWYQGESNGSNAFQYRKMFPRLIEHWRNHFKNPEQRFYFVQLANYMKRAVSPVDEKWSVIRESQAAALNLENTGIASAIDIGDEFDVHPKNKKEVGRRLALNALHNYYNLDVPFSGPVYKSFEVNSNKAIISFDNIYSGLKTNDGNPPREFEIAGADKIFFNADAEIKGNEIIVFSEKVSNPVVVRYAWKNNPNVNLYNSEMLPALPFRTDNWKVVTEDE